MADLDALADLSQSYLDGSIDRVQFRCRFMELIDNMPDDDIAAERLAAAIVNQTTRE